MATSGAGTPDPAAPDNQGGTDEHDLSWYKEQYEQIRPEFTRVTQARSEAEQRASEYEDLFTRLQDPEEAAEILAELGYEMDTGTEEPTGQGEPSSDDDWTDPLEAQVKELQELAEFIQAEREQEAQSAQEEELLNLRDEYIDNAFEYLASQPGTPEFTDDEQEILGNLAIAMKDEDGVPDVIGAYNRLYGESGILETNRERWISTKNGALPAPLGRSGDSEQRPTNRKERVAYLDARMRALDSDQS